MDTQFEYSEQHSLIAKILNLYYNENFNQAQIADKLGLSTAKVNRLLKYARQSKMVEINIHLPFPNLFECESRLCELSNLKDIIVTPSVDNGPGMNLSIVARAAANYLVKQIRPKDRICIGGGRTLSEIVNNIRPQKISGIRIFPAMGGIQRTLTLDINGIATRMAQRLGGEAYQFFAPVFAESVEERNTFYGLTHVINALEEARSARISVFGIGSLQIGSSYIHYCSLPYRKLADLVEQRNAVGEILAMVYDSKGNDCIPELSNLVIGLKPNDLRKIPVRISAASGIEKAPAIAAAIRGNYLTSLIIDENTAKQVIAILESDRDKSK